MIKTTLPIFLIFIAVHAADNILDPALYLAPSPPLKITSDSIPPGELWARANEVQSEIHGNTNGNDDVEEAETPSKQGAAPKPSVARMFWPRFSSPQPTLGIHIPLSFTLSGSYGKVPSAVTGAVANAYSSVTGLVKTGFGRSALAGSSYGNYGAGVRIYGGENTAAWSGWGNGKWGHYGKG